MGRGPWAGLTGSGFESEAALSTSMVLPVWETGRGTTVDTGAGGRLVLGSSVDAHVVFVVVTDDIVEFGGAGAIGNIVGESVVGSDATSI
jgi:hypothetical protein